MGSRIAERAIASAIRCFSEYGAASLTEGQATLLLVGRSRGQLAHHGEETGGGLFINHSV